MDAVVLAAGRGTRVASAAGEFGKPMLPLNGTPIVAVAVQEAFTVCSRVVVVAAPANCEAIAHVVDPRALVVLQDVPRGPGDALLVGLDHVESDRVLVLMSDNVFGPGDIARVAAASGNAVCTRVVPASAAVYFTWWCPRRRVWVEKEPPGPGVAEVTAWVGPLAWTSDQARTVVSSWRGQGEHPVGPLLSNMSDAELIAGSSWDIGTAR